MSALPFLAVITLAAAWFWFVHRRSHGRRTSPMWMTFSTTFASLLFIVSGSIGFILDKRHRFMAGRAWADGVIWWEVAVGIALVPVAIYFWRRARRDIDRRFGQM